MGLWKLAIILVAFILIVGLAVGFYSYRGNPTRIDIPAETTVKQLGIRSWIASFMYSGSTVYSWQIVLTNKASSSIEAIKAILNPAVNDQHNVENAFLITPSNTTFVGRPYGSTSGVLPGGSTCVGGTNVDLGSEYQNAGSLVPASITLTYSNGTISIISTSVPVI